MAKESKKKLLFVADVRFWAFDNIAKYLKPILSDKYEAVILYSGDYSSPTELLDEIKEHKADFIHFFYRAYLNLFLETCAKDSGSLYKLEEFSKIALTTGVPDHLFIEKESDISSNQLAFNFVDNYYTTSKILYDIYSKLTKGEIFLAKNIKVAEASKVIENAQRDINIAFINEVAKICSNLNISVYDVLDASNTKWNFLRFLPGLVGGHCIGVDPYYLSYKAKELKVNPEVILSGRRTNDNMPEFIFKQIQKRLKKKAKILFLGITFKEDVPDLRNSKAVELLNFFQQFKFNVSINDPFIIDNTHIKYKDLMQHSFDAIILTVPHTFYKVKFLHIKKLLKKDGILFDIKGIYRNKKIKNYWSL